MNEPYLFERSIGQQMGDLCRLAVGDAKVTQTGEIVTLENMLGRGVFGVSVEVPFTEGGVQSVSVTRCGKNLLDFAKINTYAYNSSGTPSEAYGKKSETGLVSKCGLYASGVYWKGYSIKKNPSTRVSVSSDVTLRETAGLTNHSICFGFWADNKITTVAFDTLTHIVAENLSPTAENLNKLQMQVVGNAGAYLNLNCTFTNIQIELGSTATAYEPYNGDTYTIALPTTIYGGTVNLEAGTVTSRYAADGTELAEPVVTEIDPISIPILAGNNNVWADVGTVTVSYYAAEAETFRPALWYPTIYRGLTSARYLIKRASGAIASFSDAIAAPLVGLQVALPWRSEGWQSVSVTVNGTLTTISLPTTIYGGYLDVVTGQLVATHDENGNLLTNQKLYFLPPTNINALAGANNVWSDAGDVAVSYRIDNG